MDCLGFFPPAKGQQTWNVSVLKGEESLGHETMRGPCEQGDGNVVYVRLDHLLADNIAFSVEQSFPVNNRALSSLKICHFNKVKNYFSKLYTSIIFV